MESLNSLFSSTRKPPRSRISDFLPSNIIDEIDIAPPKTSISNSSLSFKDAIDSRSTQFSSTSTLSGSYLLYNPSTIRNPERKNTQPYINSNKLPLRPRMIKSSQSVLSTGPNNYVYNSNMNYVNMQNFTFNNNNYGCYANNNNVNNQNESIETITEPQVEAYITNIQYQLGINQLSSYNFACFFN